MGRVAALVGRRDRLDRHLVSRRGRDLPRQHRPPGGEGDRAALCGLEHLCGPFLSGRRPAEPARGELRRRSWSRSTTTGATSWRTTPISAIRTSPARSRSTRTRTARCARRRCGSISAISTCRTSSPSSASRDDRLPYDPSFGAPSFSPYIYADGIREDVAVYSIVGLDGRRRLRQRRDRALPVAAERAPASAARPLGPRRARQCLALPRRASSRASTCSPRCCASSTIPDGPRHRACARSAGALLQHARGSLARGGGLAARAGGRRSTSPPTGALADAPGGEGEDRYKVDFTVGTGAQYTSRTLGGRGYARLLCRLAGTGRAHAALYVRAAVGRRRGLGPSGGSISGSRPARATPPCTSISPRSRRTAPCAM